MNGKKKLPSLFLVLSSRKDIFHHMMNLTHLQAYNLWIQKKRQNSTVCAGKGKILYWANTATSGHTLTSAPFLGMKTGNQSKLLHISIITSGATMHCYTSRLRVDVNNTFVMYSFIQMCVRDINISAGKWRPNFKVSHEKRVTKVSNFKYNCQFSFIYTRLRVFWTCA